MAIKMAISKGNIEVVSQIDDALGEGADYQAYQNSFTANSPRGDESLLKLTGEPTRFVLKRNLSLEGAMTVKDRMVTYEEGKSRVNLSYLMVELKLSLVGIINPPDQDPSESLVFEADQTGTATSDLVAALSNAPGLIENLVNVRQAASGQVANLKKK